MWGDDDQKLMMMRSEVWQHVSLADWWNGLSLYTYTGWLMDAHIFKAPVCLVFSRGILLDFSTYSYLVLAQWEIDGNL